MYLLFDMLISSCAFMRVLYLYYSYTRDETV